ncbi:MAG: hypothetical protein H6627_06935 [Calditrichae bacterium]|nr:hypothetical protein [Calditrichia bacterium]
MLRFRKIVHLVLLPILLFVISCENSSSSQENISSDSYNMALIEALDDEIMLVQQDKANLVEGDVLFSLSWGNLKGRPGMFDGDIESGHAMAIAFSDSFSVKPYFHQGGLNMGDVILLGPEGAITLKTLNGKNGGYVYLTAPGKPGKGHSGIFEPVSVPFSADYDYVFNVSGSDDFTAMDITLKSPSAKLAISNLEDGQSVALDQDLNIEWTGASAGSEVIIALLPFPGMEKVKMDHSGHPGKGPKGKKHPAPGVDPDFIRLNFDNHPAIISKIESNEGSLVIDQQSLSALVDSTNAGSLMLHISAIETSNESRNDISISKIIRMNDRIVLNLE